MSNAKRFLSVILAMIMVLSTLVIGASAYSAYKDSALTNYNKLDKPVLTTKQYASAAVDELDRMLGKEQIKLDSSKLVGLGSLDLTSVDATMTSVYDFVNGTSFQSLKGLLGDLSKLNANAFATVRRTNSEDLDVLYAVFQFLYDNKDLFVSFVDGSINMGSILSNIDGISDYTDVNQLLKKMLYEVVYTTTDANGNKVKPNVPNTVTETIDSMVQKLIDDLVVKEIPELNGYTNISSGTMYTFIDNALKQVFNSDLVLDALNGSVKDEIKKACGVEFQKNADGSYVKDANGNKVEANRDNLNGYANYLNIDYTYSGFTFTSGSFVSQVNNILGTFVNTLLKDKTLVNWQNGDNSKLMDNLVELAKAVLMKTGDDFFASYIKVATPAEVAKMSNEELIVYALRAIINGSVTGMYIPDSVTTLVDFGYYGMTQLLATSAPELDFSGYAHTVDTIIIMGVDYAIYSVNAALDMGLSYAKTMSEVDDQLDIAAKYGIDNYGGLLNGLSLSSSDKGWTTLNKIVDGVFGLNWLPTCANKDVKTFVIDNLIKRIANLDLKGVLDMFEISAFPSASDLNKTPKLAVIDVVTRIVNIIFPGALNNSATTLESLATNAALANTVDAIFSDLYNYRVNLCKGALPIVCTVLNLTNAQEFKFPTVTAKELIYDASGSPKFDIKFRNNSSGINTGYTDANGKFWQDTLYTYKIISVTSNIPALNIAVDKYDIGAGDEATFTVSGSYKGSSSFIVNVTYNVITEKGDNLTTSPLTETIYSYVSTSAKHDKEDQLSVTSGSYKITGGPATIYASSMRDLYGTKYTFENTAAAAATGTAYATSTKPMDSTYVTTRTKDIELLGKVDKQNGITNANIFETTETYDNLTAEEKDAAWLALCAGGASGKYTYEIGAKFGSTKVGKTQTAVFCYNNYGLDSLLASEASKHRQESDYSAGWSDWVTAMEGAVNVVYSPYNKGNFVATKVRKYSAAYDKLLAAVETLDANQKAGGLDSTKQILNQYAPSNEGKKYTDGDYTFFGVADFEPYTYYNYRTEVKEANRMIDSVEIPDAQGNTAVVNALTVTYRNHRLNLYGERLLKKAGIKAHLAYELGKAVPMADESKYSAASWADYVEAFNFAVATNSEADATVRQTKINTAYEMLLEYQKRLMPATGGDESSEYVLIGDVQTIETAEGTVLVGVTGGGVYDVQHYFSKLTNCTVELEENSFGVFSTDAKIYVKDNSGNIIDTYIVSVTGDVNGDGNCADGTDANIILAVSGTLSNFDSEAKILAADLNNDDVVEGSDALRALAVYSTYAQIDFVNRTTISAS